MNEQNNPQIKEELVAMQISARALLKSIFPKTEAEIFALEVGNETIEKWYNAASKQITITDTLEVETPKVGFELSGEKWKAYVTAVSAKWLKEQYEAYSDISKLLLDRQDFCCNKVFQVGVWQKNFGSTG